MTASVGIPAGSGAGDLWHDHIAHSVPDLAAASARLEQLGFSLTPRSDQLAAPSPGAPLALTGMANRCVMLREGYLEISGAIIEGTPAVAAFQAALRRHVGLHLMALGSRDPGYQAERLEQAGFSPATLMHTQRMIGTEAGEAMGRFSLAVTPRDCMPEARIPLVKQETPELVWQPRWLNHPNGALGLLDVVAVVQDVAEAADRFRRFTGVGPVQRGRSMSFGLQRGRISLLPDTEARAVFSSIPPVPSLVGYVIAVADLPACKMLLAANGVAGRDCAPGCFMVDGGPSLGGWLFFAAQGAVPPWARPELG